MGTRAEVRGVDAIWDTGATALATAVRRGGSTGREGAYVDMTKET
jgi:hypothetical protein